MDLKQQVIIDGIVAPFKMKIEGLEKLSAIQLEAEKRWCDENTELKGDIQVLEGKLAIERGHQECLQSELTRLKTGITDILSRRLHPEQTEREIKELLK
jgi:hypothetical protein